jgi:hypothetical protein
VPCATFLALVSEPVPTPSACAFCPCNFPRPCLPTLQPIACAFCPCKFTSPVSSYLCSTPCLRTCAQPSSLCFLPVRLLHARVFVPVPNPQACAICTCASPYSPVSSSLCSTLKPVLSASATFPRPCLRTCAQPSSLCLPPVQLVSVSPSLFHYIAVTAIRCAPMAA